MRALALALFLPLTAVAQSSPDPLTITLPSGKVLHFESVEQKAKFEAARSRVRANAELATPAASSTAAPKEDADAPRVLYRPDGTRKKIVQLSLKEAVASPYTYKNRIVQFVGYSRVEQREVTEGKYIVTFSTEYRDASIITYLSAAALKKLARGTELYGYITDVDGEVYFVIVGTGAYYEGLRDTPTILWRE